MTVGIYRFIQDGEVILESKNVLTLDGRALLLRFLAGEISEWAGAIAVGAGSQSAVATDKRLQFESERVPVNLKISKQNTSSIVVRGSLDPDFGGKIHEVGVVSGFDNPNNPGIGDVLAYFDPEMETMEGGLVDSTNARISDKAILITAGTAGAQVLLPVFVVDFSQYQLHDTFSLAYHNADTLAGTIRVDLLVDTSNYYRYSFSPGATTGYKITEWARSAFVATGTPAWDKINQLRVTVLSSSGTTTTSIDGLRINDVDSYSDYGLVSRSVLGTPITRVEGKELEIEYEIAVNF